MNPDFEEIKNSILNSDAHSFLKNPIKFLENIDKKINPKTIDNADS